MMEWPLAVALSVSLAAPVAAAQRGSDQPSRRRSTPSNAASQSPADPGSTVPAPPAATATPGHDDPAAPLPATTIRVRGTISTYDATGGILALSTANGLIRFPVLPGTRIRHDGHTVDRAQLKTLTGFRAAVRYSESGGHTTVESVNVFDTSERNPR